MNVYTVYPKFYKGGGGGGGGGMGFSLLHFVCNFLHQCHSVHTKKNMTVLNMTVHFDCL